jgi:hypothetical protein
MYGGKIMDKKNNGMVTTTNTYIPCEEQGFYHYVHFWIFSRRFIACELCGRKHRDTGWRLFLPEIGKE